MILKLILIIESLLADKNEPTFQAYPAKSFAVTPLHVLLQSLDIIELKARIAPIYHAVKLSKFDASCSDLCRLIKHILIFCILRKTLSVLRRAKLFISESRCRCNQHLITLGLANGTLFILENES